MLHSISSIRVHISRCLILIRDTIIPPRPTEDALRRLTTAYLCELRNPHTLTLPYHDERVRALVWEVKYYANSHALALCGPVLAEALIEAARDSIGKPLLIPIPMHTLRRKKRGHNQTELLAQAALAHLGTTFDYMPDAMARVRDTTQQQGLPQHTRRVNVTRSMNVIVPEKVRGRFCIVLDDVKTTGATLAEAQRALLAAGARTVETLALAHS